MILRKFFARLIALPALAVPLVAAAAPSYTVAIAPAGFTIDHDWGVTPAQLNDRGQIIGNADDMPVIWNGANLTKITALAGHHAYGINNRGDILGFGTDGIFTYTRAGINYIAVDGNWYWNHAVAINDAGQVLYYTPGEMGGVSESFLYTRRGTQKIARLGGDWSFGNSLNSAGHVVGVASIPGEMSFGHAFLYKNGVARDLGTLSGGEESSASDINDAGQVVGKSETAGQSEDGESRPIHAFLYERGRMKSLGTLGGTHSYATAINNAGVIVGASSRAGESETRAFVYLRGKMTDLNEQVSLPEGWTLVMATDINNRGQILARACKFEDCSYWARLTPQRGSRSNSGESESELNASADAAGEAVDAVGGR